MYSLKIAASEVEGRIRVVEGSQGNYFSLRVPDQSDPLGERDVLLEPESVINCRDGTYKLMPNGSLEPYTQ